ncbi:hypothetical protein CDAR_541021 [Caerostris darwini]|uniref:Uncharacterized protein n=1 Tax=Caerostris darwini TaxID=1538125 RepID=A0AAV4VKF6_9ARAC|nr:hypothetical protein CDAR_541021 [Caerostris darwini]
MIGSIYRKWHLPLLLSSNLYLKRESAISNFGSTANRSNAIDHDFAQVRRPFLSRDSIRAFTASSVCRGNSNRWSLQERGHDGNNRRGGMCQYLDAAREGRDCYSWESQMTLKQIQTTQVPPQTCSHYQQTCFAKSLVSVLFCYLVGSEVESLETVAKRMFNIISFTKPIL